MVYFKGESFGGSNVFRIRAAANPRGPSVSLLALLS